MATDYDTQVQQIHDSYQRAVEHARARFNDGRDGQRARDHKIAAAWHDARSKLDALQGDEAGARRERRRTLERSLFQPGKGDGTDPATTRLSYRDALDRAATISDATEAKRLLAQADKSGDELLAKAVAQHASEMQWGDVLKAYFTDRPGQVDAYNELSNLIASESDPTSGFHRSVKYALPTPSELSRLDPYKIAQLADDVDPDSGAAA